ncbi:hypothetical protein OED01_15520 [Microbacterium sp. M28]|uniref:hypothetical protein n=1 Tax=Microbacterium sp. M28 TaxID=2962064 RepID=UPI0021F4E087|nr:hypothetical protein [Microbacterium sp. M28]UYO96990.1 hypothetical protein OED01_15520 [Microbacterium sp. M28]
MVDPEQQRSRYVTNSDGAPPLPPPGGYRGARRTPDPAAIAVQNAVATIEEPKRPANAIGWIALVSGILFAVILLGTFLAGGTDTIYGVTMLALQLVVVGIAIAALLTRRGRRLGAVALSIALLFNTATVGAMGAVQTSASGSYEGRKTAEQKHEEAYPGIKGTSNADILAQPSLEEIRASSDAALADMRDRLSAEFGYTWTQAGDEDLRPERNGYGGESMLVQYTSAKWGTNEPIHDHDRKLAVMDVIDEVLTEHGMWGIISLNDETSGLDESMREKLYGSADPRTQDTWEWYSDDYPDPRRFYATIYDTSHDETGEFTASREAQSARTGEPVEGLQIMFLAPELLSEADRAEFEQKLEEYPGY